MINSCPPPHVLQQLADGVLPDSPAAEVQSHLLECQTCHAQAAALKRTSKSTVDVAQSPRQLLPAAGQVLTMDQVRVQGPSTEEIGLQRSSAAATEDFSQESHATAIAGRGKGNLLTELASCWQPPRSPDELGWLGGYRILKLLGAGGMGGVFLAEDCRLQRHIALKVMRPHVAAMPDAAERFLREARAAAAIRHENVVTIYQVGDDHGVPFIAQELLSGESLHDLLVRQGRLPWQDAVNIGLQIAKGLAAAHARGLIHRDIKPGNIWLEPAGDDLPPRVKLLDFGLARTVEDDLHLTRSGAVIGTPLYMAPEQASGDTVDHRADLFSLGSVLYQLSTGKLPFTGKNLMEVLSALSNRTPPAASSLNRDIPAALSDFITRLLAKEPSHRCGSAQAAAAELSQIARLKRALSAPSSAAVASVATVPKPAEIRWWRKPAAMVAGGMGGILLIALGIWVIIRDKDDIEVARIKVPDGGSAEIVPGGESSKAREEEPQPHRWPTDAPSPAVAPFIAETLTVDAVKAAVATLDNQDPDRRAAEWAIGLGGWVRVNDSAHTVTPVEIIDAIDKLPPGDFSLQAVHINNRVYAVSDQGLENLRGLSTLGSLDLNGSAQRITDEGLKVVGELRNLQMLGLNDAAVTDAGMEHLRGVLNLSSISLYGTKVSDRGLDPLKKMRLKNINLENTAVSTAVIAIALECWPELYEIQLPKDAVTEEGLRLIASLPKLSRLRLGKASLEKEQWQQVAALKRLRYLSLDGSPVTDPQLSHLKSMTGLTALNLRATKVTAAGVEDLGRELPQCEIAWSGDSINSSFAEVSKDRNAAQWTLDSGGKISIKVNDYEEALEAGQKLPAGRFLLIRVELRNGGERVTDAGLQSLANLKHLTHLHLAGTHVTDEGMQHLSDLPELVDLRLSKTAVSDAGLEKLQSLKALKVLALYQTKITSEGLKHLAGMTGLYELDLNGTQVGDDGLKHLSGLAEITNLDLHHTLVTDAGLKQLQGIKGLRALELPPGITDAGLVHVKGFTKLTRLAIYQAQITDAGLAHLRGLSGLTSLSLADTPVTDAGLDNICALTNLTELNVVRIKITPVGAEKLRKALPQCKITFILP